MNTERRANRLRQFQPEILAALLPVHAAALALEGELAARIKTPEPAKSTGEDCHWLLEKTGHNFDVAFTALRSLERRSRNDGGQSEILRRIHSIRGKIVWQERRSQTNSQLPTNVSALDFALAQTTEEVRRQTPIGWEKTRQLVLPTLTLIALAYLGYLWLERRSTAGAAADNPVLAENKITLETVGGGQIDPRCLITLGPGADAPGRLIVNLGRGSWPNHNQIAGNAGVGKYWCLQPSGNRCKENATSTLVPWQIPQGASGVPGLVFSDQRWPDDSNICRVFRQIDFAVTTINPWPVGCSLPSGHVWATWWEERPCSSPTASPTPNKTETRTLTATPSATATETATAVPTATSTAVFGSPTRTPGTTETVTSTPSPTPIGTETAVFPSATITPGATETPPTITRTSTPTNEFTATATPVVIYESPTSTTTPSATASETATLPVIRTPKTEISTPTATPTPSGEVLPRLGEMPEGLEQKKNFTAGLGLLLASLGTVVGKLAGRKIR